MKSPTYEAGGKSSRSATQRTKRAEDQTRLELSLSTHETSFQHTLLVDPERFRPVDPLVLESSVGTLHKDVLLDFRPRSRPLRCIGKRLEVTEKISSELLDDGKDEWRQGIDYGRSSSMLKLDVSFLSDSDELDDERGSLVLIPLMVVHGSFDFREKTSELKWTDGKNEGRFSFSSTLQRVEN